MAINYFKTHSSICVMTYVKLTYIIGTLFIFSLIALPVHAENIQTDSSKDDLSPMIKQLLDSNGWDPIEVSEGVSHFSKPIPNSTFKAYKGVCVINCPLDILYSILSDVPAHTKWITYCESSVELARPEPNQSIQYYTFDIPWPLCDRDIVVNCSVNSDWDAGRVTIISEAIKDRKTPVPVQKDLLRVTDSEQIWNLEYVSSSETKVTFYSYASMDGVVPAMLNNLISCVIPSTSLKNLKQISSGRFHSSSLKFLADIP